MPLFLSSFPRSGNTLLRQMLHAGWGLASGSVFSVDLGDNLPLIRASGHIELCRVMVDGAERLLNPHDLPLKTHLLPQFADDRAIYILRDGRAACVSLWHFWQGSVSLEEIVKGQTPFGTWSDHLLAWTERAQIELLVRYEEIISHPGNVVGGLTNLFGPPLADPTAPLRDRADLATRDGRWVRERSDWRTHWSEALDDLFMHHNAPAFDRFYPQPPAPPRRACP